MKKYEVQWLLKGTGIDNNHGFKYPEYVLLDEANNFVASDSKRIHALMDCSNDIIREKKQRTVFPAMIFKQILPDMKDRDDLVIKFVGDQMEFILNGVDMNMRDRIDANPDKYSVRPSVPVLDWDYPVCDSYLFDLDGYHETNLDSWQTLLDMIPKHRQVKDFSTRIFSTSDKGTYICFNCRSDSWDENIFKACPGSEWQSPCEIGLNYFYLMDALSIMEGWNLTSWPSQYMKIMYKGSLSPLKINYLNSKAIAVVMPIRTDKFKAKI